MADEDGGADFSFVPDTFKSEDGTFDTAAFRASYDEMAAARAQDAERIAGLPKTADELPWVLSETHAWPEGFDPATMKSKDEAGNEVAFDPQSLLDANDPDLPALRSLIFEGGDPREMMGKVASLLVNRELRSTAQLEANAAAEMKALGPDAKARIDTMSRTLTTRLPEKQAKAMLDGITSADALRGLEALLAKSTSQTPTAPAKQDYSTMSINDRIAAGLKLRTLA